MTTIRGADYCLMLGRSEYRLRELPIDHFHACVTDPPYNLGFMGKDWDKQGTPAFFQHWCRTWGRALIRTLRPGAYALVFGGTRTYHRMISGLEDAGFVVRDCLMWLYGSGFPKNHNISKAIDKAAGATREIVDLRRIGPGNGLTNYARLNDDGWKAIGIDPGHLPITLPATALAQEWEGWGAALKPAWEPIALLQKPPDRDIAQNVIRWGVGGLNIDECRIPFSGATPRGSGNDLGYHGGGYGTGGNVTPDRGRHPANLIFDEAAAAMLDAQSGARKGGHFPHTRTPNAIYGGGKGTSTTQAGGERKMGDTGGASRFFYQPKASARDRGTDNNHPTVKPIRLIRYLHRLITPIGGEAIDPFMGSGRHGIAAICEGSPYTGIELDAHNLDIAARHLPSALDWRSHTEPFAED